MTAFLYPIFVETIIAGKSLDILVSMAAASEEDANIRKIDNKDTL